MSWTLCTSGSALKKAGVNANTNMTTYAEKTFCDQLSDEAESIACDIARYDLVTNYASLTANGKAVCAQFCEAVVAQNIIGYDVDSLGRGTATLMMNVLENQKVEAQKILEDSNKKAYLGIAS